MEECNSSRHKARAIHISSHRRQYLYRDLQAEANRNKNHKSIIQVYTGLETTHHLPFFLSHSSTTLPIRVFRQRIWITTRNTTSAKMVTPIHHNHALAGIFAPVAISATARTTAILNSHKLRCSDDLVDKSSTCSLLVSSKL